MAERATDRVTRMLGIVSFLEANGDTPFAELAAQFGVSEEQIHRDVSTLWVSGLPGYMPDDLIDFDPDLIDEGIARLTAGQGVTQVRFSAREAVALIGALSSFIASGIAPAAAESAVAKLRGAIGGPTVNTTVAARIAANILEPLQTAVANKTVVELDYVDAKDNRTTRLVEPHRIVAIAGVAYLECFCRRAQGYRTLRLDRMRAARALDEPVVTAPSDEVGFDLQTRFDAMVILAPGARWAIEDLPGIQLEFGGDDVVARFGVADAAYVAGRLLSIAPYLRSVEPQELRTALAAQAQAVLAAQA
jgi:proteasome accessory factor C